MKTKIKKILAILLAVLMTMSVIPYSVFAYTDTKGDFEGYFYDKENPKTPLPDVPVALKNSNGDIIATTTTDNKGKFLFENIECTQYDEEDDTYYDNFYIIVNSQAYIVSDSSYTSGAITGYAANIFSNKVSHFLKDGENRYITQIKGNVIFTKTDSETNQPVQNAIYYLVKAGDNIENCLTDFSSSTDGSFATDDKGQITISNLPYGNYELIESSAKGYFVNSDRVSISITQNGQTVEVSQTDEKKCSVTLNKKGLDTNKPLANVEYDLYKEKRSGTLNKNIDEKIGSYVTDVNGQITVNNLKPGIYYFIETKTVENYSIDTEEKIFTLTSNDCDIELNLTNSHYPLVTIHKYKANTTEQIKGAKINICDLNNNIIDTITTKEEANTLYLAPGQYKLMEIEAPAGYLAATDKTFEVKDGQTNDVIMYDTPITASFAKMGEADNGTYARIGGAKLKLTNNNDPSISYTWETSADEDYIIEAIPAGTYTLEETKTPDGYVTAEKMTITINAVPKVQSFVMYDNFTTLSFAKLNSKTNEMLPGAILNIYAASDIDEKGKPIDGSSPIVQWTTTSEEKQIKGLPIGNYVLIETSAPNGYTIADNVLFSVTETNNGLVSMYDEPIKVSFSKIDKDSGQMIADAKLKLTNDNDSSISYTWETSADESHIIEAIPAGTYTLEEIKTPDGYVTADPMKISINSSKEIQNFTMYDELTSITFSKLDKNTNSPLGGAKLSIYTKDSFDESDTLIDDATPIKQWISTGEAYEIKGLPVGEYVLVEEEAPEGYLTSNNIKFNVAEKDNELVKMYDTPITASFSKFIKDSDNFLPGAELKLVNNKTGKSYIWTSVNNVYTISPIPAGEYTWSEINAPNGYVKAKDQVITITNMQKPQDFIMYDQIAEYDVTFKKINENSESITAEFSLTDEKSNILKFEAGEKTIKLTPGKYILSETKTPIGYKTSNNITFEVSNIGTIIIDGENVPNIITVVNEKLYGKVSLTKTDEETNSALKNAIFNLYDKNNNIIKTSKITNGEYVVDNKGTDKLTTNESGILQIDGLVFGNYILKEEVAPDGYVTPNNLSINFTIDETCFNELGTAIVKNLGTFTNTKTKVSIDKIDSITKKSLSGAKLSVINNDNETVVQEWTTDGSAKIIKGLKVGETYYLIENDSPYGYSIANKQSFIVKNTSDNQSVTMENEAVYGSIIVNKEGKILSSVNIVEKISGLLECVFNYITGKLENVTFELYAEENIKNPDGVSENLYNAGEKIGSEKTTDSYGIVKFDNLPLGIYTLKETKTVDGYIISESSKTITITQDEKTKKATSASVTIENEQQSISISINKTNGNDSPVANAVYGLYAQEDIVYNDKIVVKENELVKTFITDENGIGKFEGIIPLGLYYVKEINAPEGYKISTKIFNIDFSKNNSDVAKKNKCIYFTFDDVDKPIELIVNKYKTGTEDFVVDAKLTLTNKETGKVYAEWSTKNESKILSTIPSGMYVLTETETPKGYITSNDIEIVVSDTGENIVNMYDTPITASFAKMGETDNGTYARIGGAKLKLTNNNDPSISYTWETSADEDYIIEAIPSGTYTLEEIKTPDGYVTAETKIITIANTQKPQEFFMYDDYISILFNKFDINTGLPLAGAKLSIYNKSDINENGEIINNSIPVKQWTSTGEEYEIKGLPIGNYTLVEEKAPDGYLVSNNVDFTVTEKNNGLISMYDTPITATFAKMIGTKDKPEGYLEGATLKLINNETGKEYEWTSSKEAYTISAIPAGTYTWTEIKTPDGYIKAENQTITINRTQKPQDFVMYDDYTKVKISKQDITSGKELVGAKLSIYKNDGSQELIESWVTNGKLHEIDKLPLGKYILVEENSPDGYIISENIEFEVKETKDIQTVVMKDDYTKIEIVKQDAKTKDVLAGAKLSLYNANNLKEPIDTWETTEKSYKIDKLPVGNYVLVEEKAPNGYLVTDPIKFTVKSTGKIQTITMCDEKIIETKTETKTGITSTIFNMLMICISSIAIVLALLIKRKKNKI